MSLFTHAFEKDIWVTSLPCQGLRKFAFAFPIQRFRYLCIFLFTQESLKKEIRNLERIFKFALVFPHPTCPTPRVFLACCVASVPPSHTQRWSHIDHSWVTLGLLLYNTNISRHIWAAVTSTKVIMSHNIYTYQDYICSQSWSRTHRGYRHDTIKHKDDQIRDHSLYKTHKNLLIVKCSNS